MWNFRIKVNLADALFFLSMTMIVAVRGMVMIRAGAILAFFSYMMALKFFARKKVNNNLHFCWLFPFLGYAYLSQYWAYSADAVFEMFNNVVWTTVMGVATSAYVIYYDLSAEQIAKRLVFVACAFIAGAVLLGGVSDDGRLSAENNANVFGRVASGLLVFLFYWSKQKKWKNHFLNAVIILFVLLCLASGSRSALAMAALGGVACFYFEKPSKDAVKIFFRLLSVLALCVVGYWCVMNIDFLYNSIGNRVETLIASFSDERAADASTITRNLMIEKAAEIFKEHFWFGAGLNNFKYLTYWNTYAHCNYYELAACLGIIGFLLYYWPVFVYTTRAVKFWGANVNGAILPLYFTIVFFVGDCGGVSYFSVPTHVFLGLAIGLMGNMSFEKRNEEREMDWLKFIVNKRS